MLNSFFYHGTLVPDNQIYLERPQINRLLEQAIRSPLVKVVAGAGYGKTQTVYSFLNGCDAITAWMQLSERDNNEWRFWENFVRTVGLISRESAEKLSQTGFPSTKRQFDRYIIIPRKDIIPNVKYIFVYDDLHLLHAKPVLRFLERSFAAPFPNITSILISRTEPRVNTVSLFSKGLLAAITEDDLRFSQEEMAHYFRLQGIRPSPEAVSSLYHDTEGWAFAIYLAGIALKKKPGDEDCGLSFVRANIFERIEGEIFSAVSAKLRKFLIKLSLIDHLPLELLHKLAGDKKLIEEMEKIGTFIRFDAYLNTYRIHQLLLEYLSGKQDELSAGEKREVYVKTAGWCAEHNQKIDAITYYEKAGDYARLLWEVYTLSMILPDHINAFLLSVLDRAPEEMYWKNDSAWRLHTRLLLSLGRTGEAEAEARDIRHPEIPSAT
jgi:LuxR family maltose regulon positive regulatory protein